MLMWMSRVMPSSRRKAVADRPSMEWQSKAATTSVNRLAGTRWHSSTTSWPNRGTRVSRCLRAVLTMATVTGCRSIRPSPAWPASMPRNWRMRCRHCCMSSRVWTSTRVGCWRRAITARAMTVLPEPVEASSTPKEWASTAVTAVSW